MSGGKSRAGGLYGLGVVTTPSHVVDQLPNGKVAIRDLEIFVGFIPGLDNPDDDIGSFDEERITQIIDRTNSLIALGQSPQVILRHNTEDPDDDDRPIVGRVLGDIRPAEVAGGNGIVVDIEMSDDDFNWHIKTNRYPRRSSEIWDDGQLSEIALLGSETPARPLPDTKFVKGGRTLFRFARELPPLHFNEEKTMPDPKEDSPEMKKLKAKLAAVEEENAELKKSKNAADPGPGNEPPKKDDDDDKSNKSQHAKAMKSANAERDDWKRRYDETAASIVELKSDNLKNKYGMKLDAMFRQGYAVGADESDEREAVLSRVIKSEKPVDEIDHIKKHFRRNPIGQIVDQQGVDAGMVDEKNKMEKTGRAAKNARNRIIADRSEGKTVPAALFDRYFQEELKVEGLTEKDAEAVRTTPNAAG